MKEREFVRFVCVRGGVKNASKERVPNYNKMDSVVKTADRLESIGDSSLEVMYGSFLSNQRFFRGRPLPHPPSNPTSPALIDSPSSDHMP